MKIIAYSYTDPLFEQPPDRMIWGWEVDRVYQDLGGRQELEDLLQDCDLEAPDYLLIRRLEELGNSILEVSDRLQQLGLKFLPVDITNMEWIYKYLLPDQEPPLTRYTLGLLAFSQALDMTSAKIKLGYEPRISMEQGLDEFVRCWKF